MDVMDPLTAHKLAETLQEPNTALLSKVLRLLGPERCSAILTDALTTEASGGMLTKDGTRRRTLGGTEFIPLSFWYDAPLISPYSDRRHDPWQVCGSPTYSPVRWSSWISPA